MLSFVNTPVLMEDPVTGLAAMIQVVTQLLSNLLQWASSITSWILQDELALIFFGIMLIMLAIHIINSLVHKFS